MLVANSTWNIYNFRLPLIKKLSELGYEILILSPIDKYVSAIKKLENVRHIPLKHVSPGSINPIRDLLLLANLFTTYRKVKPSIILHYTIKPNIFGSLAARLAKIDSICVITGLGFTFLHPKGFYKIIPWLYKFCLSGIWKLVNYNEDDKRYFVENKIVPPDKCLIISGSGIDTNYFQPSRGKQKSTKFIFLFSGRLLYDKGLQEYVDAAKIVNENNANVEFWIAGEISSSNPAGVPQKQVDVWASTYKHLKFLGQVEGMKGLLDQVNVVVLPSYREGVPKAILEGMAMGKPIITTDVAGCKDTVVDGKNGFIVDVKDSNALANAMQKMISKSPFELDKMGAESRYLTLSRFDEKIITSTYVKLFIEYFHLGKNRQSIPAC